MKKVWVVIVNFNGGERVVKCLKSLESCSAGDLDCELKTLVVDNASTDGSVEKIRKLGIKNLELIENQINLGFGAACNIGIKRALKKGADYILLLNPDTKATKNFLKPLLAVIKRPKVGICGPKILLYPSSRRSPSGHLRGALGTIRIRRVSSAHSRYVLKNRSVLDRIWAAGGEIDKKRFSGGLIGNGEEDRGQYEKEKEVDYISGTCMLIKNRVFEKIGFLPEEYFLYYEDVEFCFKARKVGFKVIYVPSSVIYHFGSFSIGKDPKLKQYYMARNHLLFVERYAPFLIRLREFFRLPKTIWEHFKKKEIWAVVGIKDYFLRRFFVKVQPLRDNTPEV